MLHDRVTQCLNCSPFVLHGNMLWIDRLTYISRNDQFVNVSFSGFLIYLNFNSYSHHLVESGLTAKGMALYVFVTGRAHADNLPFHSTESILQNVQK